MSSYKKIFVGILVVLTVLAVWDLAANGPEVIANFFEKIAGEMDQPSIVDENTPHQEKSETIKEAVPELNDLVLMNARNVDLQGTEEDEIEIDYKIIVYADSGDRAAQYLSRVQLQKTLKDGTLYLSFKEPDIRDEAVRGIFIDYKVKVPEKINSDVHGSRGIVTAQGLNGNVNIRNDFGKTKVSKITGNIEVNSRVSSLEVIDVDGNIIVSSFNRYAYIADITGDVFLQNHQGEAVVENIQGNVDAVNQYGHMAILEVNGRVEVEDSFGGLDISGINGAVSVDGRHSDVSLKDSAGDIDVAAEHGNIRVDLPAGASGYTIDVQARHGEIITRLPLEFTEPGNNLKKASGNIGNGDNSVRLKTQFANIYLSMPFGKVK